ncbi:hypothetical protein HPO_09273 [Hyphomonas polymorpha PS728]|uniref:DUF4340 domain-containing protein n=1 Tax=Hyphomonas polymorpha PS728 TaxID=1280954 RepID=A0A062VJI0_9PROT|nr:DUF4340 domain-containing protein [Hyphomonas polymorpha]KCZ98735.1 hypothetical protein HPO_09273 [Hyphomonas polymorpha PS728]
MTAGRSQQRTFRVRIMAALAGGLAVAAIASQFIGSAPAPRSDLQGQPVLPGFAQVRADAREIRVTLADESYTLFATPGGWRLSGTDGYPIRADRLNELAGGLETLVWDAPRTRDPAKMNAIGLGDPRDGGNGALVEVIGPDGEVEASLLTGRKDEHIYVRRPGEMQAYRVTGTLPPLYSAQAWLDLDIIDLNGDAVAAVRLTDATGASLYLQRTIGSSDRAFVPAPPYQDYQLVNRLVTTGPALALTRLQPVGVRPASALRTRPVGTHITQTHDGLEVEVRPYREADGFFITLRAIEAGEGAHRAAAINERARGWAFQISQIDWMDFAPAIASIAQPPGGEAPDEAAPEED